jgi:alpha-L-fucosidase
MKQTIKYILAVCALLTAVSSAFSQQSISQDERMQWWRDARFGLFIHWGLYAIPGGEWKGVDYGTECGAQGAEWIMAGAGIPREEYRELTKQFNPVEFDAEQWVSLARAAGMKYIVITSKHHDGFCLFDTEHTDYNVMDATPFKRDIIKELADACAKQDMRFGVYYSHNFDWYHSRHRKLPKEKPAMSAPRYLDMVQGHIRELLTNYGDMAVLWFDMGFGSLQDANAQGALVRELQPKTIICSRLYQRSATHQYADFVSLPDRQVASARVDRDTETCMTMRHNWGYDRDDNHWKSTKDVIERLVLSASRGVNFLLNVGPTPEGTFCPEEIERLQAVGKWMEVNGESIHETAYSPLDFDFPWGVMTQKQQKLYLHVMQWNPDGISFNGVLGTPAKAYLLADPERKELDIQHDTNGHITTIDVPGEAPDPHNSVIVLEFNAPIEVDKAARGRYHWSKSTGVEHGRKKQKRTK